MKKTRPLTKLPARKKGEGHIRIRHDKHGNPKYQMIIETWKDGILYRKARTCDTKDEVTLLQFTRHVESEQLKKLLGGTTYEYKKL